MLFFAILILIALLVIPTVVIGELIYGASRQTDYDDIAGYTSLTLQSPDGVQLQAWYTQQTDKVALLIHGHGDHSQLMQERYAPIFTRSGYDIVLLDLRNHGRSEHQPPVSMGIEERADVITALTWIESQKSWNKTVLFGTSMGSISAILAQNETDLADRIIVDSSFANPLKVMNKNFAKNYVIQPWRYLIIEYLTKVRHEVESFPDILSILDNLDIPTLVAHGSADIEAPPGFLQQVDDLDNAHITTILVEGGEHSRLHEHEQFRDTVVDMLEGKM